MPRVEPHRTARGSACHGFPHRSTLTALVCAGDHDSYSTAEITSELAGCLPSPDVVVMEGVGHLPNLERPDAFNAHLLRFLARALP